MSKLRAAVIGLDHVHTKEMIEAFTKNPDTDLVGIAEYHDCTEEELQFHLRRHTPEGIEPEVYRDYKELLKQNLDIAVVCTGVNDHADIVEETLALGINTIIEKPMALNMNEAKRMYRAYKASSAQLMINWPVAWFPCFRKVKELADAGVVGDILRVEYRSPATCGPYARDEMPPSELAKSWWFKHDEGGGAIIESHSTSYLKIPFAIREMEDFDAKCIIAKKASELVKDGDVIMLDASSSAYAMIPYLAEKNNITVITCGIKALIQLGEYGINVCSTGGRLLSSCMSLVDSDAMRTISEYNADIVFFSCRGISPNGNITDFSIEENLVRRSMIEHSKKAVLLCASEKLNKTYMHNLCSINDIDHIISEVDFSDEMLSDT